MTDCIYSLNVVFTLSLTDRLLSQSERCRDIKRNKKERCYRLYTLLSISTVEIRRLIRHRKSIEEFDMPAAFGFRSFMGIAVPAGQILIPSALNENPGRRGATWRNSCRNSFRSYTEFCPISMDYLLHNFILGFNRRYFEAQKRGKSAPEAHRKNIRNVLKAHRKYVETICVCSE